MFSSEKKKDSSYYTWGCADDLVFRLQKTLYCSDKNECFESSSSALTDIAVTMFLDASKSPKRKLTERYASSLTRQLPISPCSILLGILYTERLRQTESSYLNRVSSADLYIVSLMVASKFLVDEGEQEELYNDEWAEAAGLAKSTVNKLEVEFLAALQWNLYVSPKEFLSFCNQVESKIALKYALRRGWFSYTDLSQLLNAREYHEAVLNSVQQMMLAVAKCTLMYSLSISVLVNSMASLQKPTTLPSMTTANTTIPSTLPNQINTAFYPTNSTNFDSIPPSMLPFRYQHLTFSTRSYENNINCAVVDRRNHDCENNHSELPKNNFYLQHSQIFANIALKKKRFPNKLLAEAPKLLGMPVI